MHFAKLQHGHELGEDYGPLIMDLLWN